VKVFQQQSSKNWTKLWLNIALGLICALGGCSAPYDNPLDPRSDHFQPPVELVAPPNFGFRVFTKHISYDVSGDSYQVHTEIWVEAPQEMDSAFVRYQDDRYYALSGPPQGVWGRSFTQSFFRDTLFQKVIGNPFTFLAFVTDWPDSFIVGPGHVVRLIEQTPILFTPTRGDTTHGTPQLTWADFDSAHQLIYPFAYLAQISNLESTIWQSPLLADTTFSVVVDDTLTDGSYYWTISVVDSFNNVSRSKEGRFEVLSAQPQP
jgi:hypothetical protein